MPRTNIDLNEVLLRKARRFTGLKSKSQIVHRALEQFVLSESRKYLLRNYASADWKKRKAERRNRD
jgi:Arc/MetJ family transcription regulator